MTWSSHNQLQNIIIIINCYSLVYYWLSNPSTVVGAIWASQTEARVSPLSFSQQCAFEFHILHIHINKYLSFFFLVLHIWIKIVFIKYTISIQKCNFSFKMYRIQSFFNHMLLSMPIAYMLLQDGYMLLQHILQKSTRKALNLD